MSSQEVLRNQAKAALKQLAHTYVTKYGGDLGGLERIVANTSTIRQQFANILYSGQQRDVAIECGYPIGPQSSEYYRQLVETDGIAWRINSVWPEETWRHAPEIFESSDGEDDTPFDEEIEAIFKKHNLAHYMERADVLSGVGRYGILLLGIDDGQTLDKPVVSSDLTGEPVKLSKKRNLTYVRVFDETLCPIAQVETNEASPRFSQPVLYNVTFYDPSASASGSTPQPAAQSMTKPVHWQRVIHLADNRTTSEIIGTPRTQRVLPRLLDLVKILGASAQGYWNGGFPGISFETDPDIASGGVDVEGAREQIELYMSKLQRYLALDGLHANSLEQQIADPEKFVEVHLTILSLIIGMPKRVLMGSEVGELASSQDRQNTAEKVTKRRTQYATPCIVRPLVERLIQLGIVTSPVEGYDKFEVEWPDVLTPSDDDKAATALKWAQVMQAYVQAGCDTLIPPKVFMQRYLGLSTDEIEAVEKELEKHLSDMAEQDAEDQANALEQQKQTMELQQSFNPPPAPPAGKPAALPVAKA